MKKEKNKLEKSPETIAIEKKTQKFLEDIFPYTALCGAEKWDMANHLVKKLLVKKTEIENYISSILNDKNNAKIIHNIEFTETLIGFYGSCIQIGVKEKPLKNIPEDFVSEIIHLARYWGLISLANYQSPEGESINFTNEEHWLLLFAENMFALTNDKTEDENEGEEEEEIGHVLARDRLVYYPCQMAELIVKIIALNRDQNPCQNNTRLCATAKQLFAKGLAKIALCWGKNFLPEEPDFSQQLLADYLQLLGQDSKCELPDNIQQQIIGLIKLCVNYEKKEKGLGELRQELLQLKQNIYEMLVKTLCQGQLLNKIIALLYTLHKIHLTLPGDNIETNTGEREFLLLFSPPQGPQQFCAELGITNNDENIAEVILQVANYIAHSDSFGKTEQELLLRLGQGILGHLAEKKIGLQENTEDKTDTVSPCFSTQILKLTKNTSTTPKRISLQIFFTRIKELIYNTNTVQLRLFLSLIAAQGGSNNLRLITAERVMLKNAPEEQHKLIFHCFMDIFRNQNINNPGLVQKVCTNFKDILFSNLDGAKNSSPSIAR